MKRMSPMIRGPDLRTVPEAWNPFAGALAETLARLAEDECLVISIEGSGRYVQFAAQGVRGLHAEVVSNAYLRVEERLDVDQTALLLAMGWHAPTGTPDMAARESDPESCANFHVDCLPPLAFGTIADLAVQTLTLVLGAHHPSRLQYAAIDAEGRQFDCPALGLRREARAQGSGHKTDPRQQLLQAVRSATGLCTLELDDDGDIPIRYGSAAAFVRYVEAPPCVRFHCVLLHDVDCGPRLQARMNDLNDGGGPVRFYLRDDALLAYAEIPAAPIVPAHVEQALHAFFTRCDGLGPALQRQFGGDLLTGSDLSASSLH